MERAALGALKRGHFFNGFLGGIDRYRSIPSGLLGDAMALTVADLSEHIIARRRLYALALGADIELLRRVHALGRVMAERWLGSSSK